METKLTKEIKLALLQCTNQKIGTYGAFEVSFGSHYFKEKIKERCDYVEFDGLNFTCFEIKVSKADYLSNSVLSRFGQRNYIVAPKDLANWIKAVGIKKKSLGSIGIISYENHEFKVIRRCSKLNHTVGDNVEVLEGFAKAASRDLSKLLNRRDREISGVEE